MLKGIQNFLTLIYENWTTICVIIGLLIGIYEKVMTMFKRNEEHRLEIDKAEVNRRLETAKRFIKEGMLDMVTRAEDEYDTWKKSGEFKRSQVIKEVFDTYPILEMVTNQDEVISWIDEQIDNALVTLRDTIEGMGRAE